MQNHKFIIIISGTVVIVMEGCCGNALDQWSSIWDMCTPILGGIQNHLMRYVKLGEKLFHDKHVFNLF
jgi:hypothetical protein